MHETKFNTLNGEETMEKDTIKSKKYMLKENHTLVTKKTTQIH